jgi:hypothetical protein
MADTITTKEGLSMDRQEKHKLLVRPIRTPSGDYLYNGQQFDTLEKAMFARAQALRDLGIKEIAKEDVEKAEAARGKALYEGQPLHLPQYRPADAPTGATTAHSHEGEDGIANLLTVFAWIVLLGGLLLSLILAGQINDSSFRTPPLTAFIPAMTIAAVSVFQFALLAGFARIINYLGQIARQTR